ncbi:triose-phosphate isomerase [soil metagenome]
MRQKYVAGNWKMFTTATSAESLAREVAQGSSKQSNVKIGLFPPFPYLGLVVQTVKDSAIVVGAQDVYPEKEGAFTGEVSPVMLADVGCRSVLVGHSERRHKLGESDAFLNRKVSAALAAGFEVVFCIGETLDERESNQTQHVLAKQIHAGLAGIESSAAGKLVIAYEPVWAIGTGRNATPHQAQDAHHFVRRELTARFGENVASALPILYGGSVKPDNAAEIMGQADVDGALVGGASLVAAQFLAIVQAAE